MLVAVGSGNPVKRDATAAALSDPAADDRFVDATVVREPVDSGVAEQPRGAAETRRGAVRRAVAAREATDAAVGVGIEGGVGSYDPVETAAGPVGGELCLLVWAAVTDGTEMGVAAGPSMPLPAPVAERVADGEELGPVVDDLLDESGVARGRGTSGVVTGGRVEREAALRTAVAGALAPFRSPVE
ncbi:DUF84 family protein [Halobaculum sp. MBLA0143]|uniref:DUF84 family protein n=1 Tax=Halobaculum sp. MBLA0143 TaxID=3079933 RepID=UPI003523D344